jgi:hypothetical protein
MRPIADRGTRLDAAMARAIDAVYPIDPETGLRLYNPDGVRTTDINQLLEMTHDQTDPDRGSYRTGPKEKCRSPRETPEDHVESNHRSRAARTRRRVRAARRIKTQHQGTAVNVEDSARQLDALARAPRRMSRETTRLRRSMAVDAQRLVNLEGATDGALRSLQRFQHQAKERR